MKSGVINANRAYTFSYPTTQGTTASYTIPNAADEIRRTLETSRHMYEVNPAVVQWFCTVFLNWAKTQDDMHMPLADYLGERIEFGFDDSTQPRSARDLYAAAKRDLPDWAAYGEVMFPYMFSTVYGGQEDETWRDLTDFLTVRLEEEHHPIAGLSVPDALRLSQAWRVQRAKMNTDDVEGVDIRSVMSFNHFYRMVRILTSKGLDRESIKCNHCIGRGGYDSAMRSGRLRVYSLRDAQNNAHATIGVLLNNEIQQLKGHNDQAVTPAVWQHIKDFILTAGFRFGRLDHDKIGINPGAFNDE